MAFSLHNTDGRPWYREPWPWILMTGPAIVVVAGFTTAFLAVKSNDGLVEDDYYKQGLEINQTLDRDRMAANMGLRGEFSLSGDKSSLVGTLTASQGKSLPEVLSLHLNHPTRAGLDQDVTLVRIGDGKYSGKLENPISGRWYVTIEDGQKQWRLTTEWNMEKQASVNLGAKK